MCSIEKVKHVVDINGNMNKVEIIALPDAINGTRRTIAEKITVDTIQDLELLRGDLKAKFKAVYVDFVYVVKG